jgi:Avidin family
MATTGIMAAITLAAATAWTRTPRRPGRSVEHGVLGISYIMSASWRQMALTLLLLYSAFPIAFAVAAPSCATPVGEWTNQIKPKASTLKITSVQNGALRGTYVSPSGTEGDEYTAVGWVAAGASQQNKDNAVIISFSVSWGSVYGSITSWTGVCRTVNGVPTLTALWHLGMSNSVLGDFDWAHVLSGQDTFRPK